MKCADGLSVPGAWLDWIGPHNDSSGRVHLGVQTICLGSANTSIGRDIEASSERQAMTPTAALYAFTSTGASGIADGNLNKRKPSSILAMTSAFGEDQLKIQGLQL